MASTKLLVLSRPAGARLICVGDLTSPSVWLLVMQQLFVWLVGLHCYLTSGKLCLAPHASYLHAHAASIALESERKCRLLFSIRNSVPRPDLPCPALPCSYIAAAACVLADLPASLDSQLQVYMVPATWRSTHGHGWDVHTYIHTFHCTSVSRRSQT